MAEDVALEKQATWADNWGLIHVTNISYAKPGTPATTFVQFEWVDVDGSPFGYGGTLFYLGGLDGDMWIVSSTSPRMKTDRYYLVLLATSDKVDDQDVPLFELPLGAMSVLEIVEVDEGLSSDAIVLANPHHKLKSQTTEGAATWSTLLDVMNEVGEFQFKADQGGGSQ